MDYHKATEPLRLREYGRNVQIMADALMKETDPLRQQLMANELVRIMGTVAPTESKDQKDSTEYKKKIWDHLYRITEYQLNPKFLPQKPLIPLKNQKPVPIPYSTHHSKYKPYGRNVELLIEKAVQMPESIEKNRFIFNIAHIMRTCLFNYSNGVTSDKVVFDHLAELSKGQIILDPQVISLRDTSRSGPLPPQFQHKKRESNERTHDRNRRRISNNPGGNTTGGNNSGRNIQNRNKNLSGSNTTHSSQYSGNNQTNLLKDRSRQNQGSGITNPKKDQRNETSHRNQLNHSGQINLQKNSNFQSDQNNTNLDRDSGRNRYPSRLNNNQGTSSGGSMNETRVSRPKSIVRKQESTTPNSEHIDQRNKNERRNQPNSSQKLNNRSHNQKLKGFRKNSGFSTEDED